MEVDDGLAVEGGFEEGKILYLKSLRFRWEILFSRTKNGQDAPDRIGVYMSIGYVAICPAKDL